MKKLIKTSLIVTAILLLTANVNFAKETDATQIPATYKVAKVDIAKVVSKSAQVQALKTEQQKKLEDLKKWLDTVRADVQKQQTKEGQEKLIKKYDNDFAKKQEEIKSNYAAKLQAIDKSISETIERQAKAMGYDLVLAKGTVLYGGDDITDTIIKYVK